MVWNGIGQLTKPFYGKREWRREDIVMQLPGQFNIYNALAAISVAGHFKVDREQIKAALAKQIVPGRCQNMSAGAGYVFLIDYAHNEMSLRNLLETLRKFEPARLIVILDAEKSLRFEKVSDGRDGRKTGRFYHYHLG